MSRTRSIGRKKGVLQIPLQPQPSLDTQALAFAWSCLALSTAMLGSPSRIRVHYQNTVHYTQQPYALREGLT